MYNQFLKIHCYNYMIHHPHKFQHFCKNRLHMQTLDMYHHFLMLLHQDKAVKAPQVYQK